MEQLIKESKNLDISKLSVKFVIDNKAHKMTSTISGSITNTKEKASADLNLYYLQHVAN
ncbi:hypothetical protein ICE98_03866 [Lactococcus lactis]|nr:hypothetical protein [Lactococcus lactis]